MSFSRPIQWYHSHVDPILPDGHDCHNIVTVMREVMARTVMREVMIVTTL